MGSEDLQAQRPSSCSHVTPGRLHVVKHSDGATAKPKRVRKAAVAVALEAIGPA